MALSAAALNYFKYRGAEGKIVRASSPDTTNWGLKRIYNWAREKRTVEAFGLSHSNILVDIHQAIAENVADRILEGKVSVKAAIKFCSKDFWWHSINKVMQAILEDPNEQHLALAYLVKYAMGNPRLQKGKANMSSPEARLSKIAKECLTNTPEIHSRVVNILADYMESNKISRHSSGINFYHERRQAQSLLFTLLEKTTDESLKSRIKPLLKITCQAL